jgi:hypothetical protein
MNSSQISSISLSDSSSTSINSSSLTSVSSLDSTGSKIIDYELLSDSSEKNNLNYALNIQLEEDFETADLLNTSLENLKSQSQIVKIVSNKSNSLDLDNSSMIKISQASISEDIVIKFDEKSEVFFNKILSFKSSKNK